MVLSSLGIFHAFIGILSVKMEHPVYLEEIMQKMNKAMKFNPLIENYISRMDLVSHTTHIKILWKVKALNGLNIRYMFS